MKEALRSFGKAAQANRCGATRTNFTFSGRTNFKARSNLTEHTISSGCVRQIIRKSENDCGGKN